MFARDHHRCLDCGSTEDLTLDYLIPLQDGGTMTENNAATRCRPCNSSAGRRADPFFEDGARLPPSKSARISSSPGERTPSVG